MSVCVCGSCISLACYRYYMSNCCFKGDLCPFSHNWDHKPDTVCKYYLKGACVNGKSCRYDHVKPPRDVRGNVGGAKQPSVQYVCCFSPDDPLPFL